ncbi:sensor histidine kinase [Duganella guangzhouensis]
MNASSTTYERDYWFCQLMGWGVLGLLSILSSSLGDWHSALRMSAAKLICTLAGLGLSHLWRRQLQRRGWLEQPKRLPLAAIASGVAIMTLLQTGVLLCVDLIFNHAAIFDDGRAAIAINLVLVLLLWFVVFAIWTLCYAVALTRRRANRFALEKLQLGVSVKDAELRALQAQINPHFFFNSLNSIRALAYQDADACARAINSLASMMRHTLQTHHTALVPLADELQAVQAYLAMEQLRFAERLVFSAHIKDDVGQVRLPPLVLQTLVENAIRHGVERSKAPCQISVEARRRDGAVEICVANQGQLAEHSQSTRLGLANARQRLLLQCGPAARCTLTADAGWVYATIVLPEEAGC